jgi:DNA-binding MarR family transcriptional regulator
MAEKPSDIAVTAWARLLRAHQTLLERVAADLKDAELPPLEWYDVLLELKRESSGRLRQFELGKRVLLSKYNLSRLLDRLQDAGLVKRQACRDDARGTDVAITAAGLTLQQKMWPVYQGAIGRHFARQLSRHDAEMLAEILARLMAAPA